jgi:hypothetical protein
VDEICELAVTAGLTVRSCWGDFERTPYTESAAHMVFVLER